MDTDRLEAFSDGVFAIAITLLILEVRVPGGQHTLAHRLGQAWPGYLGYAISFTVIGIMWANHHVVFRLIARADHLIVLANLLFLLFVAFIPFPTKVLGDELGHGTSADKHTAVVFYGAVFTVTAITYNLLWRSAAKRPRFLLAGSQEQAAIISRRFNAGPPSYLVATLAGLISVPLSLALYGALAVFYVVTTLREVRLD